MWIEKYNFLREEKFNSLSDDLEKLTLKKAEDEALTEVEKKKIVYKLENMPSSVNDIISYFGSPELKKLVSEITGWNGKIYSLFEMPGFGGYAPYHTMKHGGFLGSHVDHSHVQDGEYIHIANSIFYASTKWLTEWGGATQFFDESGTKQIGMSYPEPNKLVVFIHDSNSFHGVSRITSPPEITRRSFYMDYYIHKSDLELFKESFLAKHNREFLYFKYLTMFLPIPKDNQKYLFSAMFKRSFFGYLRNYVVYLSQKNKNTGNLSKIKAFFVNASCNAFNLMDIIRGKKR
jgi:hypothetical protein